MFTCSNSSNYLFSLTYLLKKSKKLSHRLFYVTFLFYICTINNNIKMGTQYLGDTDLTGRVVTMYLGDWGKIIAKVGSHDTVLDEITLASAIQFNTFKKIDIPETHKIWATELIMEII